MKSCLSLGMLTIVAVAGLAITMATADETKEQKPKPQLVELSGRLHRPVKWTPQLELIPSGQIKRFDVRGKLLQDTQEGTFLRVRGIVRSRLHRGGTEENLSPFPAQWIMWLEVTDLEVLDDPLDVLKEIIDNN